MPKLQFPCSGVVFRYTRHCAVIVIVNVLLVMVSLHNSYLILFSLTWICLVLDSVYIHVLQFVSKLSNLHMLHYIQMEALRFTFVVLLCSYHVKKALQHLNWRMLIWWPCWSSVGNLFVLPCIFLNFLWLSCILHKHIIQVKVSLN
jgi:hypothetical protein